MPRTASRVIPSRVHKPLAICVLALSFAQVPLVNGEPPRTTIDQVEIDHELSMDFETPHTKWAKPYARGKTRVLFFAPWYQGSTDGREIIELMQRFDLEADAVYLFGGSRLLGDGNPRWYVDPEAGTNRVMRLLEKPYDVYFFNRVEFDVLPDVVKERLIALIRDGAGSVVAGDIDPPEFLSSQEGLDAENIETNTLHTVGKGRLFLIPEREKLEFSVGWETEFDYEMARQGRILLTAADRAPQVDLKVEIPEKSVAISDLPGARVNVSWGQMPVGTELRIEWRRWDGKRGVFGAIEATGQGEAAFELPFVRSGDYHIDVFARSNRGIENWATEPFSVISDHKVSAVELEKDWGEIGETLHGKTKLEGKPQPGEKILVRLVDRNDRFLAQQDFAPSVDGATEFEFRIEPWMPMLLRVEAVLMNGAEEISSAYSFFRVTKRHQNQFNFVVWNYPSGDLAPYGVQSMADCGTTAILQVGEPPLILAQSELSWIPYATSFRWSSHTVTAMLDETGTLKNGCLHDEDKMAEWVRSVVERSQTAREHGVLVYSLGDENAVRGSCLSDHCLQAYRSYLERVYGDISALNSEWEANYTSFDAIELLEGEELPSDDAPRWFKEFFAQRLQKNRTDNEGTGEQQIAFGDKNDEMLALQAENFPRWYDRQAFQCENYVHWCKRFVKAFREIDPHSLTGFEGTDSFTVRRLTTRSRQGGDLDAFVRELEYFGPYPGPANEVVRSLAPPTFPMGNWIGYSMEADVLLKKYWDQVTNCMNTVQWWRWDNLDGYHGFLSPTFAPFPEGKELLEDTQIVRDGLGDLLMNCEMQDDRIAMLYSMPSTHIAHFDGNRSYGNYKRDHSLWHEAIHDCGLQFRYFTDRMLRQGEFAADRYEVLILPLAFAVGPKEADVIREFVREGGTLLADVRPGIYDGHCKPLESGILDGVFGIKRTGKQDAIELDRLYVDGEINGHKAEMRWGNWYGHEIYPQMKVDPTVVLTSGQELGKASPIHFWDLNHPVCIVNEFGKGHAVLLNFPIYDAPAQPLIESILASAGVTPMIRVLTSDGETIHGLEITRWKNEEIELVALFGTYKGEVTVHLPEGRHVYDLKRHEALGEVGQFTTCVLPHRASFFALMPNAAPEVELDLGPSPLTRGSVGTLSLQIPNAKGKHAVRFSASTSMATPAEWFRKLEILSDERREISFPIAYNDPLGEWTVRAVDLYTDQETSLKVTVE